MKLHTHCPCEIDMDICVSLHRISLRNIKSSEQLKSQLEEQIYGHSSKMFFLIFFEGEFCSESENEI